MLFNVEGFEFWMEDTRKKSEWDSQGGLSAMQVRSWTLMNIKCNIKEIWQQYLLF